MLKIKDNVDLKELEKFGFKYISNYDWKRYSKDNIVIFENVDVSVEDFQKVKKVPLIARVIYTRPRTIKSYDTDEMFIDSILFDLIQAGLVEKVSD